ncbi:MAG: hypothetical protein KY445_16470, partial [Armatimonadetes bacterium]|nr:hypothetical protein [Armatimonadota bacterium]
MENPFLIRELRQLGRRPRAVQVGLGSAVGVMGAVLLFWVALASNGNAGAFGLSRREWEPSLLWILGAAHVALCGIAAGYGGYRLLAAEHYRSTLDSIQLLPYHPLRWLLLKLAFPVLGVVIAWLTGFPFYFLAALCSLVPLEGLLFSMHKPLLAGAGIILISLLTTPDYLQRTKQAQTRRATGFRSIEGDLWVWTMLVSISSFGLGIGIVFGEGLSETVWLWGGFPLPEAVFWLVGFVAVVPAAFLTAITALVTHEKRERIAHFARLVALATGYYLAIGFYWAALATWMKWGLLLVLPLGTAIMQSHQGQRRESGQSEKYVQWIAARCDNALLLRDLRVYSRFLS